LNPRLHAWTLLGAASAIFTVFLTYAIVDLLFSFFGVFLLQPVIPKQSLMEGIMIFTLIASIAISLDVVLVFLSRRRRRSITNIFKENPDARMNILLFEKKTSYLVVFPFCSFLAAVILLYSFIFLVPLKYFLSNIEVFYVFHMFLSEVIAEEIKIFPYVFSGLIGFVFSSQFLLDSWHPQLKTKELLTYFAENLQILLQSKKSKRKKELDLFTEYFVKAFGDAIFSSSELVREIDLSSLNPLIMATFLGTHEEKLMAEKNLHRLQQDLSDEKSDWQIGLIEWLQEIEGKFPRLSELDSKIKIRWVRKRRMFSVSQASLRNMGIVITIIGTIVAIAYHLISMF